MSDPKTDPWWLYGILALMPYAYFCASNIYKEMDKGESAGMVMWWIVHFVIALVLIACLGHSA